MKMLGLNNPAPLKGARPGPQLTPVAGGGLSSTGPGGPAPGPYCLANDGWDRAVGERLAGEVKGLGKSKERGLTGDLAKEAWTDFMVAAHALDPVPVETTVTRRKEFLDQLTGGSEFQALRQSTVLNPVASEIAAVEFAKGYCDLLEKDRERRNQKPQTKKQQERQEAEAEMDLMAACGGSMKAAQEGVEQFENACKSLGLGQGNPGSPLEAKKLAELYQTVRNSNQLKRICELAGRYRRVAQSKQRQKSVHGMDDVVGVDMDNEVSKLLPVELGKLGDEDLELDTLRRFAERQTQCREYRGVEPQGKGPVVVVVDESGSMDGEPVYNAKAFALAMAWVARKQNRWCALVGFSGGTEGTRCVLPPGKWDEAALCQWLTHFYGGGTTCDVPFQQLPEVYWPEFVGQGLKRGKTDLIVLTDGVIDMRPEVTAAFLKWKEAEKVRLIGLVLNSAAGELAKVSDECYLIGKLGAEAEAVSRCLSL